MPLTPRLTNLCISNGWLGEVLTEGIFEHGRANGLKFVSNCMTLVLCFFFFVTEVESLLPYRVIMELVRRMDPSFVFLFFFWMIQIVDNSSTTFLSLCHVLGPHGHNYSISPQHTLHSNWPFKPKFHSFLSFMPCQISWHLLRGGGENNDYCCRALRLLFKANLNPKLRHEFPTTLFIVHGATNYLFYNIFL